MNQKKKCLLLVPFKSWFNASKNKGSFPEIKSVLSDVILQYDLSNVFFIYDRKLLSHYNENIEKALRKTPFNANTELSIIDTNVKDGDFVHFCCIEEIFKFVTLYEKSDYKDLAIVLMSGDSKFVNIAKYCYHDLKIEFVIYAPEESIHPTYADCPQIEFKINSTLSNLDKKNIINAILSLLNNADAFFAYKNLEQAVIQQLRIEPFHFAYIIDNLTMRNIIIKNPSNHPETGDIVLQFKINNSPDAQAFIQSLSDQNFEIEF